LAVDELGRAVGDLPTIAAGVRPPRLDEGLAAALADLASAAPVAVELETTHERLPSQVEAAAYFVACEAVTNAVKHASPSRVNVQATGVGETLRLVVADDGIGGANLAGGTGLTGLSDRVEAQGGTLLVHSPTGAGTRIEARIPCRS
jgi:signal transduction histidine kinase